MSLKIMIVDDEPNTVELVKIILEMGGFEVLPFTEPFKAMKFLKTEIKPDLILLDMRMPDLSGPDFCEMLRMDQNLLDLKVVFFTASSDHNQNMLKRLNILGCIQKPFDTEKLEDQVKEFLY